MPPLASLLGPLLQWELIRLARRKQVANNRILFLYLLFLATGLFILWWAIPANPIHLLRRLPDTISLGGSDDKRQGIAYFAEHLALVLLETQLIFVALFAPAYATFAVSEEKDRQTLPLLMTTELTDSEIIWWKCIARVMLILSAVAAGIPFLVLFSLLGSISIETIVIGYALTIGTAILSVSIGVSAACRQPDTRTALSRAYLLVAVMVAGLPFFFPLSSFAILAYAFGFEGMFHLKLNTPNLRLAVGLGYATLQAVVGQVLLIGAIRNLRKREPTAGAFAPSAYPEPPRGRPTPIVLSTDSPPPRPLPPLDSIAPVLWMERHIACKKPLPIFATSARWLTAILAFVATILFVVGAWQLLNRAVAGLDPDNVHLVLQRGSQRPAVGGWLLAAGELMAALYLLPLTVGLAGCVAGERQRQTLDSLLMTLLPRRNILWSKVKAHLERSLGFGVGSVAAIGCDFGAVGGIRCGLVTMVTVVAGFWFLIAYAAWLSVRCPTPGRAFWLCLLPLLSVIALPFLAWSFIDWTNTTPAITALIWVAAILFVMGFAGWWRGVVELNRGE